MSVTVDAGRTIAYPPWDRTRTHRTFAECSCGHRVHRHDDDGQCHGEDEKPCPCRSPR